MHQAHTDLNKKNGGVNSFLVTVWLSIMVRSLRSREKKNPVQQQVGLPIMALFPESRLIHTEPCLLSRRGKPEWVSTFATHCINVNIVKAWTDEWSLAHSFIFLIDMTWRPHLVRFQIFIVKREVNVHDLSGDDQLN